MGLGIALVPEISWRGLFSERIKLIDIGSYTRNTYLYVSDGHTASRASGLFYDLLADTFSAEMR
jgi:DNA-binding transcriptional LysR family regulator